MLHTSNWIANSFHFYECAAKDSRWKKTETNRFINRSEIFSREWIEIVRKIRSRHSEHDSESFKGERAKLEGEKPDAKQKFEGLQARYSFLYDF